MAPKQLTTKKPIKAAKLSGKSKTIKKASARSSPANTAATSPHSSASLGAAKKKKHSHIMPSQVIQNKRDGKELTEEEIRYFIEGFTNGTVPDYQMAALAMATCFKGMTFDETMLLTRAIVESGKTMKWSNKGGYLCDKHSTGGQGDKTSLILAPLVACCGLRIPMISGRGLGPTGGTLDKLEAIKGFRVGLTLQEVTKITDSVGLVIAAQTAEIAPADKKLYGLRDVTATVSCLPLIVSSIMSKKLAENVDGLVLDVKWGSGAFMRSQEDSLELGKAMVEVGKRYGKHVVALQTNMNQPLGDTIGNSLEIQECYDILAGKSRPTDLMDLVMALGAEMLAMAGKPNDMEKHLKSGAGLKKFQEMIRAQGGDPLAPLPKATFKKAILSPKAGYVSEIECGELGYAVIALGGGRKVATDALDYGVGFEQPKKIGDKIAKGQPIIIMHYSDPHKAAEAEKKVLNAYKISDKVTPKIKDIVTRRIV